MSDEPTAAVPVEPTVEETPTPVVVHQVFYTCLKCHQVVRGDMGRRADVEAGEMTGALYHSHGCNGVLI